MIRTTRKAAYEIDQLLYNYFLYHCRFLIPSSPSRLSSIKERHQLTKNLRMLKQEETFAPNVVISFYENYITRIKKTNLLYIHNDGEKLGEQKSM